MNYKNIYKSICNQIRKNYILETTETSPMPSDGGGGQYFYPTTPPNSQNPISPTRETSEPNPQPVTPKPNPHLGDPNFHQFPISPGGMPIQVWVFNPFPFPGSFQLFGWNGQQYNPIGQPVPQTWPNTQQLPNQNIPVVLPYGFPGYFPDYQPNPVSDPAGSGDKWPDGYLNNPIFGPSNPADPGGLQWPPGFNPNFWSPEYWINPPGHGVTPHYPHPNTPDVHDPYGPRTPGGMPPQNMPGMFPGGLYPYRPHDPNYDPQNPFFRPTEDNPIILPPRRPNPPPRPQRDPTDIFYGFD